MEFHKDRISGGSLAADRQKLRDVFQTVGMLPVLMILTIGFHILSGGRFFTFNHVNSVMQQAAINTVLGTGMTFVILAGGIDLSISANLAACAIIGLTVSNFAGLSYLWFLAPLLGGLGLGLINGFLIARLQLPPVLVTLGSLNVVLGLAREVTGDMTVYNSNLPYAFLGTTSVLGIPAHAIIALVVVVVVVSWFILTRTVFGKHVYSVGCNKAAARLSGINVPRVQLFIYGISGLSSGIGAIMLSSKVLGANAMQVGHSYFVDAFTAVILGGTSFAGGIGSIWGTVIGALIITSLSAGLIVTGVPDVWQYLGKGLIIIAAVALDRLRHNG